MGVKEDLICTMSESANNNIQEAYNRWAEFYDSNKNKTRDTEAIALREMLSGRYFDKCLEIGCGTGKNTFFLAQIAKYVTAVDFSEEMLAKAQLKILSNNVTFKKADINENWHFAEGTYDIVVFSLVLEHIDNLNLVFEKVKSITNRSSMVYIGELHPFKQYTGTKARFETVAGTETLTCYDHNVSDFISAASANGFVLEKMKEYIDNDTETRVPRILSLIFIQK